MKKIVAGVDIGGTNTVVGIVDIEGNILAETSFETKKHPDFNQYIAHLSETIKGLDFESDVMGIGIGAPNANHNNGTIENAANLIWPGILNVKEEIQKYFSNKPVILANDANAAAIGEKVYGNAKFMKDFIMVTLGTGLGAGFVSSGKLVCGHDSFAGELGHVTSFRGGRQCGCGKKGCLETYVSASGIKRTIFELLANSIEDSVFRNVTFSELDAKMITQAAQDGDPIALEAYEISGRILGEALADAVAITSPEAIFLFGGLAKAGELIFAPTHKYLEENLLKNYKGKIKILPSALENKNTAIIGASALAWEIVGYTED